MYVLAVLPVPVRRSYDVPKVGRRCRIAGQVRVTNDVSPLDFCIGVNAKDSETNINLYAWVHEKQSTDNISMAVIDAGCYQHMQSYLLLSILFCGKKSFL